MVAHMLVRVFFLKTSDQRHRTCSSVVLKEESGGATLASEGIVACLARFESDLKQNKKDQADLKDNDAIGGGNGGISCPA